MKIEQLDQLLKDLNRGRIDAIFKANSVERLMASGYRSVLIDAYLHRSLTNKLVCNRARNALECVIERRPYIFWYVRYIKMGE